MLANNQRAVTFVVPGVRIAGALGGSFFLATAIGLIASAFTGDKFDATPIVFGILIALGSIIMTAAFFRGYAITVSNDAVQFHRLWTSTLHLETIETVDVIDIYRGVQPRLCLCFRLKNQTERVFKDFNGSRDSNAASYRVVHEALSLIEERLRTSPGGMTKLPPRPPTAVPAYTDCYDGHGGPRS